MSGEQHPPKRSAGALKERRKPLPWPSDRDFRILSIDGGGIRGVYPATVLAGLERRYLAGAPIAGYFDLIAGTSTGGILALGLGAGLTGAKLRDLYVERGCDIFPPIRSDLLGAAERRLRKVCQYFKFRYDRKALMRLLKETLGNRRFGEAKTRLCIPSFEGRHGEVYIFKTSHHPNFEKDAYELMTKVGAATAAAPTFFQPLEDGGYTFVDGGVWANNPIMISVVDALSCFDVPRERIRVLSLGCGDDPYVVDKKQIVRGGIWHWREIFYGAMRLQSLNALGQAGLLIGPERIVRANAPTSEQKIEMDDWTRAVAELPAAAEHDLDRLGDQIATSFLIDPASRYEPLIQV
jgi:patatin-like phospholipase/acyl hydrolase